MKNRGPQTYERRLLAVSNKLERLFLRLAMLGFLGILFSQFLLSSDELRQQLSKVDSLEGTYLSNAVKQTNSSVRQPREISIRLISGPAGREFWVTVNKNPVGKVGDQPLSVKVSPGDLLEIDTTQQDSLVRFEIDHNDPEITSPSPGTIIESGPLHSAIVEPILFRK